MLLVHDKRKRRAGTGLRVILAIYLTQLCICRKRVSARYLARRSEPLPRPAGTKTLLRTSSNAQDLVGRRNKFRLCSNWAFGTPSSS